MNHDRAHGTAHPAEEVASAGALDERTCIDLIGSTPVGRLGFQTPDGPLVLPVNHAWWEGAVVFRSSAGGKLAAAAEGQPVCFEVDQWDPEDRSGWSVVVQGTAREVTDWAEREVLENIGLVPWMADHWRRLWIRVDPDVISGRMVVGPNR